MKFVIFRSSQPFLEKPLVVGTCKKFESNSDQCSTWNNPEVVSNSVIDIEMGDFRFEGDPRPFKCNQIEIEKAEPTYTRCRGQYTKTY